MLEKEKFEFGVGGGSIWVTPRILCLPQSNLDFGFGSWTCFLFVFSLTRHVLLRVKLEYLKLYKFATPGLFLQCIC